VRSKFAVGGWPFTHLVFAQKHPAAATRHRTEAHILVFMAR
jgi:hypothetical protein